MNIYDSTDTNDLIVQINKLTPAKKPNWGKMSLDQMLTHLNVVYLMAFTDKDTPSNSVAKFLLKLIIKKGVVVPKPNPKNGRTEPQFIIKNAKNFDEEKKKLISYIEKVRDSGNSNFEGKESQSFDPLTAEEWNVLFAKHMEHHLTQFGI
ncbi:MAG TPA: hypothetical protein DCW93_01930 [Saprospirales bacterium]|nr:hypothetical protein [Saprospirales bacterium]